MYSCLLLLAVTVEASARADQLAPIRIKVTGSGTGVVQSASDLTMTALRVGTCTLCVHHGIDKLKNVDMFAANVVAKSFRFMPGSPKLWTYAAAAAPSRRAVLRISSATAVCSATDMRCR